MHIWAKLHMSNNFIVEASYSPFFTLNNTRILVNEDLDLTCWLGICLVKTAGRPQFDEDGFLFTPDFACCWGKSWNFVFISYLPDRCYLVRKATVQCTLSSLGGQKQAGAFLPDSLLFLDIVVDLVDKHAAHANQTLHCGSFLYR